MALKKTTAKEMQEKSNNNAADKERIITLEDGQAVTVRLIRPINPINEKDMGAELAYIVRSIWFAPNDKPDEIKGLGISLPQLSFDKVEDQDHLDPMTFVMANPDLLVSDKTGKQRKVQSREQVMVLVEASEVYPSASKTNTTMQGKMEKVKVTKEDGTVVEEEKFVPELKIIFLSKTTYLNLVTTCNTFLEDTGEVFVGRFLRIQREGTKTDTKYHLTIFQGKQEVVKEEIPINVELEKFIYFRTFKAQKDVLAKCGIKLPYEDPEKIEGEGEEVDTEWDDEEDAA